MRTVTTQPTPTAMRFGRRVHRARRARGWTQQALGRAANLTAAKVSRIEAGLARTDLADAEAIASALCIPPSVLTGWAVADRPPQLSGGPLPAPPLRVVASNRDRPSTPSLRPMTTAEPGYTPLRVAGLAVMPRAVHAAWCGHTPRRAVVGHPELRECTGCGVAVEGRLSRELTTAHIDNPTTDTANRMETTP